MPDLPKGGARVPRRSKKRRPVQEKRGQPEKEIDLKQLETLCQMQATTAEIAAWFNCSPKTIERHREKPKFKAAMDNGRLKGLVSLRRAMFQNALDGNVASQIFLSKNLLGMRDKPAEVNGDAEPTTKVEYKWVAASPDEDQNKSDPSVASECIEAEAIIQ